VISTFPETNPHQILKYSEEENPNQEDPTVTHQEEKKRKN
jgi:hypothetical protein